MKKSAVLLFAVLAAMRFFGLGGAACVLAAAFALYALADIKPSTAPFVALTVLLNINILFSLFNMLKVGVYAAAGLSAALFAAAVAKSAKDGRLNKKAEGFLTPSVLFLIGACALLRRFFAVSQPVFSQWDEFSFWGIAAKQTFNHNAIYTYYKSSMLGVSIPPALPVLVYMFEKLGFIAVFSERRAFFAYDFLILCGVTAMSRAFDEGERHLSRLVSVFGVAVVFFFANTGYSDYVSRAFMSAYSDYPMAFLFAGTLRVYILQKEKGTAGTLCAASAIIALTFTKDMGFALSCIAAFILFFDSVFDKNEYRLFKIKGIFAKILSAALMLCAALCTFMGWSAHLAKTLSANRTDFGGEAGMSMFGMLISGVKELLIPSARSEKFTAVTANMISAFFDRRVCAVGSGLAVCVFIAAIFAVAFLTAKKQNRRGVASAFVTSAVGFVGYYVFHLFLYVYVFRDEAYTLASYERYMSIYYLAWLCLAFVVLTLSAKEGKVLPQTACLFATAFVLLLFARYVKEGNMLFSADKNTFSARYNITQKTDYLKDAIEKDDVIWVYSGGDSGGKWFIYCYELSDNYIVPDFFAAADGNLTNEENAEKIQAEMLEYFKKYNVTNVLVDFGSAELQTYMGDLFDADPGEWGLVSAGYYKVNYTDGGMTVNLLKGGTVID